MRLKVADFVHLFRNKDEEKAIKAVENARNIAEWMEMPYQAVFEQWLDKEASKPLDPKAEQTDLVIAAVRANTMKEVRTHLSGLRKMAKDAFERARELAHE